MIIWKHVKGRAAILSNAMSKTVSGWLDDKQALPPLSDETIWEVYGEPPQHGIRFFILVVLRHVEWADIKFVTTFSTLDLAPRPTMVEIANHLAWLVEHGYMRERCQKTRTWFWQQPREERFYEITPEGRQLYRQTETRLQAGQLEFALNWNGSTTEARQRTTSIRTMRVILLLAQIVLWVGMTWAALELTASLLPSLLR